MKNLSLLIAGFFFCIALSYAALVLNTQLEYGDLLPIAMEEGEPALPIAPVGLAEQGKEAYTQLGCVYCHTQQVRQKGYGVDYQRGWGERKSVPRDYILQERVLVGNQRTGPDLMNVGERVSDVNALYLHLYNPQILAPGTNMPAYHYLFEEQKIGNVPSATALVFPESAKYVGPASGYEVVPTQRAKSLVAYLLSLSHDYEYPEIAFPQ